MRVFQVSEEDVGRNGFGIEDIGLWCFMVQGCVHGYKATRAEAQAQKECKSCGSGFTPEHRDQGFCDYECYATFHGIDTWTGDEELWDETELEAV